MSCKKKKTDMLKFIKIRNFYSSNSIIKNNENINHNLRTHLQKTHLIQNLQRTHSLHVNRENVGMATEPRERCRVPSASRDAPGAGVHGGVCGGRGPGSPRSGDEFGNSGAAKCPSTAGPSYGAARATERRRFANLHEQLSARRPASRSRGHATWSPSCSGRAVCDSRARHPALYLSFPSPPTLAPRPVVSLESGAHFPPGLQAQPLSARRSLLHGLRLDSGPPPL